MNWDRFVGEAIYIDTNIAILSVESHEPQFETLRDLFEGFERGLFRAMTSELTVAEVLVKPLAARDDVLISRYQELFSPSSGLEMLPVNRPVLMLSAEIRSEQRLTLFDAIHVASARLAGCHHFLTQDERLGRALADQPKWLKLSEIT